MIDGTAAKFIMSTTAFGSDEPVFLGYKKETALPVSSCAPNARSCSDLPAAEKLRAM
jgi:hypothetical protein